MNDTELLDALDAHLKNNGIWRDTVLAYDHEDGVWLAHAERGTMHLLPAEIKGRHESLRDALRAALAKPQGGGT